MAEEKVNAPLPACALLQSVIAPPTHGFAIVLAAAGVRIAAVSNPPPLPSPPRPPWHQQKKRTTPRTMFWRDHPHANANDDIASAAAAAATAAAATAVVVFGGRPLPPFPLLVINCVRLWNLGSASGVT